MTKKKPTKMPVSKCKKCKKDCKQLENVVVIECPKFVRKEVKDENSHQN